MQRFAGPGLTPAVYADYLRRQWQLHAVMEAALAPWVPPDWVRLRLVKASWLAQDLAALGSTLPPPRKPVWPEPTQASKALGALYVLEGATLGVQVVARRAPGVTAGARRFLDGYGPHTGAAWREFLSVLESTPADAHASLCRAAVETFDAFLVLFSEAVHEPSLV